MGKSDNNTSSGKVYVYEVRLTNSRGSNRSQVKGSGVICST